MLNSPNPIIESSELTTLELINTLKDKTKSAEIRCNAAYNLGNRGDNQAVEPLIYALKDKNSRVGSYALQALEHFNDERVVEALIFLISNNKKYHLAGDATGVLGRLGNVKAVAPLIVKSSSPDSEIRYFATIALGMIGGSEAVIPLIARLEDENNETRFHAALWLGEIGDIRALPYLEKVRQFDKGVVRLDYTVVEAAATAIAKIKQAN